MSTEKQHITLNGKDIPLVVRRHKAAKRVSLRLMPAGDGVVLTLPMRGSLPRAMAFLQQKADWVLTHVAQTPQKIRLEHGATIPVLGVLHVIERMEGRGVTHISAGKLYVYGAPEFTARRVKDFLKKHLHAYCLERAQAMAAQLGKSVRAVRIAAMRSRWGSCSVASELAFNARLVFAPGEIVDYLIAHEVAHLAQMDHSQRFWQCVAVLYPDYSRARAWLKREGQSLYRYQ